MIAFLEARTSPAGRHPRPPDPPDLPRPRAPLPYAVATAAGVRARFGPGTPFGDVLACAEHLARREAREAVEAGRLASCVTAWRGGAVAAIVHPNLSGDPRVILLPAR